MASDTTRNEPFLPDRELQPAEIPEGVDRRAFLMRSALIGATAVLTGHQMNRTRERPQRHGSSQLCTAGVLLKETGPAVHRTVP